MFSNYSTSGSWVTHVREVALLPEEKVTHIFTPDSGITREMPAEGQVLVTTNQRIIAFSQEGGREETFLLPMEELKGVALKSGSRSSASLFQGLLLAVGGLFVFVLVAYWLEGRIGGPKVPIIEMGIGSLLVLLVVIWGAVFIGRYYFAREDNSVTFQGSNWTFSFPYRGEKAEAEIYQVVNNVFATRRTRNGYSPLWEE